MKSTACRRDFTVIRGQQNKNGNEVREETEGKTCRMHRAGEVGQLKGNPKEDGNRLGVEFESKLTLGSTDVLCPKVCMKWQVMPAVISAVIIRCGTPHP